jgi:hypothetical protein
MAKAHATPKKHIFSLHSGRKRTDPGQFKRFIEAARKRGVDESLEDFAARFRKIVVPPKPVIRRQPAR